MTTTYPTARAADLEVGDVILGPDDEPVCVASHAGTWADIFGRVMHDVYVIDAENKSARLHLKHDVEIPVRGHIAEESREAIAAKLAEVFAA